MELRIARTVTRFSSTDRLQYKDENGNWVDVPVVITDLTTVTKDNSVERPPLKDVSLRIEHLFNKGVASK